MAELPYMNAPGYIAQVLDKIKSAATPPKFTQDFLETKLAIKSSSARPIIPFFKKLGLLTGEAVPTARYSQFRNQQLSGTAIAEGMREAYALLFDVNEYAHEVNSEELKGLVMQVTGLEKGNQIVNATVSSFEALKRYARFDSDDATVVDTIDRTSGERLPTQIEQPVYAQSRFNLSYTINLNLPETSNPEVFDAIFKSLRENILKQNG